MNVVDLQKAKRLLEKLKKGGSVSLRDLQNTLGEESVDEYDALWQDELEQRKQFDEKPADVKQYEALVHAADFDETRADAAKPKSKRSKCDSSGRNSAQRLREQAEHKYELAWEYLSEIISKDPNLASWFDRDVNDQYQRNDRDSIPRTVTSRSTYKVGQSGIGKRSKAEVKKQVLEGAIERTEQQAAKLKGLLEKEEKEEKAILKAKLAALRREGWK